MKKKKKICKEKIFQSKRFRIFLRSKIMQYSKFRSNWKIFLYIIRNEKKFYEEKKIHKGNILQSKRFRIFLRSKIMQYSKFHSNWKIFLYIIRNEKKF